MPSLTPQQYDIARAANRLLHALKQHVPATTSHYAVVNAVHSLDILLEKVDTITTADVKDPNAAQAAPQNERDHYQGAVEWLLNSRHVDHDVEAAFHMLAMGLCTEEEADSGYMEDGRELRDAYREHQKQGQ